METKYNNPSIRDEKWLANYEVVKAHVAETGHFPDKHSIGNRTVPKGCGWLTAKVYCGDQCHGEWTDKRWISARAVAA